MEKYHLHDKKVKKKTQKGVKQKKRDQKHQMVLLGSASKKWRKKNCMRDNRRLVVVGLELGQLESRVGVCSSPNHGQRTDELVGEEPRPVLHLSPTVCFSLLDRPALGPGHLCISARLGGPCLASQDTSKNPPSPSGEPGLVMPRPCHTDRSFREGEKLRKKKAQVLKKVHNTFFCLSQICGGTQGGY